MANQVEPLEQFQAELMRSELMAQLIDACARHGLTLRLEGDGQQVVIEIRPAAKICFSQKVTPMSLPKCPPLERGEAMADPSEPGMFWSRFICHGCGKDTRLRSKFLQACHCAKCGHPLTGAAEYDGRECHEPQILVIAEDLDQIERFKGAMRANGLPLSLTWAATSAGGILGIQRGTRVLILGHGKGSGTRARVKRLAAAGVLVEVTWEQLRAEMGGVQDDAAG